MKPVLILSSLAIVGAAVTAAAPAVAAEPSGPTAAAASSASTRVQDAPLAVTSDPTFSPYVAKTVTGTGAPGATILVSIETAGVDRAVKVGSDGTWSITIASPPRVDTITGSLVQFGVGAVETARIVLESDGTTPTTPAVRDLVVTSDTAFDAGSAKVLTGTGTPGAQILVSLNAINRTYSTTVAANGEWSVSTDVLGAYGTSLNRNGVVQFFAGSLLGVTAFDLVQR